MNIILPMAGRGRRFAERGYTFPKPLIEVHDRPMIQIVVDNINLDGRYIFIVQKEHCDKYSLNYLLPLISKPNECEIIQVDCITEGAACTVLLAEEFIDNEEELIIANADQWIDWSPSHFVDFIHRKEIDGAILTFNSTHPKHSFCRINDEGIITEVAEKKPISNHATVGMYYFRRGSDFVRATNQMISKNIRTNNEFYICPVYNELIQGGGRIYSYPVVEMKGLGTPEELERFLRTSDYPYVIERVNHNNYSPSII